MQCRLNQMKLVLYWQLEAKPHKYMPCRRDKMQDMESEPWMMQEDSHFPSRHFDDTAIPTGWLQRITLRRD
jgi:hypothetical protein